MRITEKYGIDKDAWFYYGQWEQAPLSIGFYGDWYDKSMCDEIGFDGITNSPGVFVGVNGHCLVNKKDMELVKARVLQAVEERDAEFFERLNRVCLGVLEDHLAMAPLLEKSEGFDEKLFYRFLASTRWLHTPWLFAVILSDYIGKVLMKKAEEVGVEPHQAVESVPQKETLMIKQYREALEIRKELKEKGLLGKPLDEIKKDGGLWKKIQGHVKEFEWVGTHHFWGEPLSVERLLKEVAGLEEGSQETKKEVLPKELEFVQTVATDIGFLRQYTPEVLDLVNYEAKPMLNEVAKKLGLTYEELLYLTPNEVSDYLGKEAKPSKAGFMKRKTGCCLLAVGGKQVVVDDPAEVELFRKEMVPQKSVSGNEIKGTTACKGRAKGVVKIFLVPEGFSKMNKGDILVTTMTTPDFVPIMHKAAAIVTDIGGVLSHAGIVSREMGKPCIVGTRIGTQWLKDGDLVEVDATKGVVIKL